MKVFALKVYTNLLLVYFLFSGLGFIIAGPFAELAKFAPIVWILFVLFILICQIAYLDKTLFRFKLHELLFWGAIFCFTGITLFLNGRLYLFGQFFSVYLQIFCAYLIIPLLRGTYIDKQDLFCIEKSLELFCWLNVAIVILNFLFPSVSFFGESYNVEGDSRAFGWMGDQIAVVFSFYISIFLAKQKFLKAGGVFIALLATGSINATFLAVIVVAVFFWPYFKNKMKSRNSILSFILIFFVFCIVFYFYVIPNATIFNRLSAGTIDPSDEQGVGFHRLIAFQTAVESWFENKFIGCGFGTYSTIMHKKFDYLEDVYDSTVSITSMVNAFNQYLQFLVEIGLIGLIIAIVFFRNLIKEISINSKVTDYNFSKHFKSWFIILLLFNQTAVWFLPGSLILFIFFLSVALSVSKTSPIVSDNND